MLPDWVDPLAEQLAAEFLIEKAIILALIEQESGGDPLAVRYEPGFQWFKDVKSNAADSLIDEMTEEKLQAMSFGLMQVMGATARVHGLKGNILQLASSPAVGLRYGVTDLAAMYDKYSMPRPPVGSPPRGWADPVIAAYNAGSARRDSTGRFVNAAYVESVKARYTRLKA